MADLYFVVGSPVAHSLSPAMMTAAFEEIGRSAAYGRLEVGSAEWPGVSRDLYERGVCGLNVTVPHKESALRIAVDATPVARAIGAANTLLRGPDGWSADNTDGPGFLDRLRESGALGAVAAGALVLGAGGGTRRGHEPARDRQRRNRAGPQPPTSLSHPHPGFLPLR